MNINANTKEDRTLRPMYMFNQSYARLYLKQLCAFLVCISLFACDDTSDANTSEQGDMMSLAGQETGGATGGATGAGTESLPELSRNQRRTTLGIIEGEIEDTVYGQVLSFKGLPYAQAPIDQLRFKAPQELAAWDEILEAKEFGPVCPQKGALVTDEDPMDEDCLSLNIWLPLADEALADEPEAEQETTKQEAQIDTNGKAVMLWIHGGGFIQGAGSFPLYDGARLASRGDVIVITFNYRLGVLGFLNTQRLVQSTATQGTEDLALTQAKEMGNFGIQDQIHALKWVQKHIADLGGDPSRVTVFGESAGGFSICALLASPLSQGLFQQAIIESGGGCNGFKTLNDDPNNELEQVAANILNALDCGELSGADLHLCLAEKSSDELLEAMDAGGESILGLVELGPSQDGVLITGRADQLLQESTSDHPNIIIGSNADEMTLFTYNQPISLALYENFLSGGFGLLADQIFELYPAETDQEARKSYNNLLADLIFVCPTLKFASTLHGQNSDYSAQVWVYHFMHSIMSGVPALLGATHALEIPFVFNNHHIEFYGATANEDDKRLSDFMSDAWLNFAKVGSPSSTNLEWPSFRASPFSTSNQPAIDDGQVMLWKIEPELSSEPIRNARCQSLNELRLLAGQ